MDPIVLQGAAIGPIVAFVLQLFKAMPFAESVLGEDEKTQKLRMQLIVWLITIGATAYIGVTHGLFHVEQFTDLVSFASLVLGSSYTTYQGLIKKGSEYLPEGIFKV